MVLAFAVWSLLSAASLLLPGDAFSIAPSYRSLVRLGVPEEVWGGLMLCDALVLVWITVFDRIVFQAAATAVSGGFWLYFGAHVLVGGMEVGILSVIGCWEVVAGLGLLAATVQWAGYAGGAHGR